MDKHTCGFFIFIIFSQIFNAWFACGSEKSIATSYDDSGCCYLGFTIAMDSNSFMSENIKTSTETTQTILAAQFTAQFTRVFMFDGS